MPPRITVPPIELRYAAAKRPSLDVKQVTGDERHQRDVGMQLALGGMQHQPGERLNEGQRDRSDPARPTRRFAAAPDVASPATWPTLQCARR